MVDFAETIKNIDEMLDKVYKQMNEDRWNNMEDYFEIVDNLQAQRKLMERLLEDEK